MCPHTAASVVRAQMRTAAGTYLDTPMEDGGREEALHALASGFRLLDTGAARARDGRHPFTDDNPGGPPPRAIVPAGQFRLDERETGRFLARARRRHHGLAAAANRQDEAAWHGDPDWTPGELPDDEMPHLDALVHCAQTAGAITGPPGWEIHCLTEADSDGAWYIWSLTGPPGTSFGLTAECWGELRHIGDAGLKGTRAALAILREAIRSANLALDGAAAALAGHG